MKIDSFGCIVMEKDGMPGDIGDSCAETGRFVTLTGLEPPDIDLAIFATPAGFLRHPLAPKEWNYADFTSDQGTFLLMGLWLTNRAVFNAVVLKVKALGWRWFPDGHFLSADSVFVANGWFHFLGVATVVQIFLNTLPLRWSDDQSRRGFWKYWRFTSSANSTISYVTVFVSMVFLRRVGVRWPEVFFNRELYLAKTKSYYSNQPNSAWFVELFERAKT